LVGSHRVPNPIGCLLLVLGVPVVPIALRMILAASITQGSVTNTLATVLSDTGAARVRDGAVAIDIIPALGVEAGLGVADRAVITHSVWKRAYFYPGC
jgi:hypothetical protein